MGTQIFMCISNAHKCWHTPLCNLLSWCLQPGSPRLVNHPVPQAKSCCQALSCSLKRCSSRVFIPADVSLSVWASQLNRWRQVVCEKSYLINGPRKWNGARDEMPRCRQDGPMLGVIYSFRACFHSCFLFCLRVYSPHSWIYCFVTCHPSSTRPFMYFCANKNHDS